MVSLSYIEDKSARSLTIRPNVIDDIMNLINNGMQARYSGSAVPQILVTLRRGLEALNASLKEFVNMKMLAGIKTCGTVRSKTLPSYRRPTRMGILIGH